MTRQLHSSIGRALPTSYPTLPAYSQTQAPVYAARDELDNRMAVTAVLCGLTGFFAALAGVFLLPLLVAVPVLGAAAAALGFVAAERAARGEAGDRGIALAGMWIGIGDLALSIMFAMVALSWLPGA